MAAHPQSPRSHCRPGPARSAPRHRRCAAPPGPRTPCPPPPHRQTPHRWMRWPRPWQRCQGRQLAGARARLQPPSHDRAGPWAMRQAGLPRCHGRWTPPRRPPRLARLCPTPRRSWHPHHLHCHLHVIAAGSAKQALHRGRPAPLHCAARQHPAYCSDSHPAAWQS